MVALIPWWSRVLFSIVTIVVSLSAAAVGAQYGLQSLYIFYPLIIASHFGIEALRPGGTLRSSGLGITPRTIQQLLLGSVIAVISIAVVVVTALTLGAGITSTGLSGIWTFLPMLILISIGEEVMFRGVVFEAIRERFGANIAVAITAVLFGVAHAGNEGVSIIAVINVTTAGVLFGAMVVRTSALWMSIGYHIFWNAILYLFVGSVSGSSNSGVITRLVTDSVDPSIRWIVDGPFGIEQGLMTSIVLIAGIVATAGWARPDQYVRAAKLRRMRREHELSRP